MPKQQAASMLATAAVLGHLCMGCVFERAESNGEDDAPVTYGVPEIWIEAETVSGRVGGRSLRLVQESGSRVDRNGRSAKFQLTDVAATGSSRTFGDPAAPTVPVDVTIGICPLSRLTSGSDPSRYEYLLLHVCTNAGDCYTGRPGEIWLELEQLDLGARRVTVEYDWPDGSSLSATFRYGEQRQTVEM